MGKRIKRQRRVRQKRAAPDSGAAFGLLWRLFLLGFLSALLLIIFLLPTPKKDLSSTQPAFEEPLPAAPRNSKHLETTAPKKMPVVAIIIDDMGYNYPLDEAFINLPAAFSFAFLPYAPYTRELAEQAARAGKDVLVHMPMEPRSGSVDPGPGAIYRSMDLQTIRNKLNKAIEKVPFAAGINNHMGSGLTADINIMHIIMAEIKKKGLFFIDSRTTKDSVAYKVARVVGVEAAERDVFLDHVFEEREILKEVNRLVEVAGKKGWAVAIGHPHMATYRVLYNCLPLLQKRVKIISVNQLLEERLDDNEIWRRSYSKGKIGALAKPKS